VIVLDASVVVETLLQRKDGLRIQERVLDRAESRHAPHLLDVEVIQVVRRYRLAGRIDLQRAGQMLDDLSVVPIERHAHKVLLRANLTAYDAPYVALAEALGAPLLTRDGGLASVPGHDAAIELV
jgi:predicted nucleic acid-binding protein